MSSDLTTIGDMLRVNLALTNERVWVRRRDGAYPHRREPMDWLEAQGLHYRLSEQGMAIQDAVGYDGYRHGGKDPFKIISGTYAISYRYGDVREGPDSHLYREPDYTYGPLMGHYWFNVSERDIALLFKLTWG
jgi:hypothetical protein